MAQKRHIVFKTDHLKDPVSWTSGLAGIIRLLTWETDNVLGISKTQLQERVLEQVYQLCENKVMSKETFEMIKEQIKTKTRDDIESTSVEELYDDPIKGLLISPIEAQRRLRLFSEEFLNKEFDVFMSLLPNYELNDYFNCHFSVDPESEWNIIGSSNDFEASTGIKFMYMDTLAYSHNTSTLVALELKMDSPIGKDQLLKYCFMAAYLEEKGMISKNSSFRILILGNDSSLKDQIPVFQRQAEKQLEVKQYPKKGISPAEIEKLLPRVETILNTIEISNTTWQDFGDHFDQRYRLLSQNQHTETLCKLIDGFLFSLKTKHSREQNKRIYLYQAKDV